MNERMLRAMFGGDDDDAPKSKPLPEAVIAELKAMNDTYQSHLTRCPFKPGDIVTPLAGHGTKAVGEPHVVLDTIENPQPHFTDEPASNQNGRRLNIRVACFRGEHRATYWVESFEFELYETAQKRKADEAAAGLDAFKAA